MDCDFAFHRHHHHHNHHHRCHHHHHHQTLARNVAFVQKLLPRIICFTIIRAPHTSNISFYLCIKFNIYAGSVSVLISVVATTFMIINDYDYQSYPSSVLSFNNPGLFQVNPKQLKVVQNHLHTNLASASRHEC